MFATSKNWEAVSSEPRITLLGGLCARAVAAIMATRAAIFSMLKRRGRDGMDKKKVCVWVWVWGQASRTTEEEIGDTR